MTKLEKINNINFLMNKNIKFYSYVFLCLLFLLLSTFFITVFSDSILFSLSLLLIFNLLIINHFSSIKDYYHIKYNKKGELHK